MKIWHIKEPWDARKKQIQLWVKRYFSHTKPKKCHFEQHSAKKKKIGLNNLLNSQNSILFCQERMILVLSF